MAVFYERIITNAADPCPIFEIPRQPFGKQDTLRWLANRNALGPASLILGRRGESPLIDPAQG
jgi:hypothetical protein